ncbi:MAG: hypothetical protein K2J35_03015, partial [Eubacterium sp.]|nr:hypothetical protein [Eubacterium sp.]
MNISFKLKYEAGGKQFTADSVNTEHFLLNVKNADNKLNVSITPKAEVKITEFIVKYPYHFNADNRIFVNGYQSWTDSYEYT